MSMAQLVAAGAPELPEGWFYRVGPARLRGCIRVSIRRARLVGSTEEEWAVVTVGRHADERAAVVSGCQTAYRWWSDREGDRAAVKRARAYYGDHDPKGGR